MPAVCRTRVRTKLAAGKAQTYNVGITNNGPTPEEYFVDARLPGSAPLSLTSLTGPDTTVPLTEFQNIPEYLVPSHSTQFTEVASTTGSTPIMFDSSSPGAIRTSPRMWAARSARRSPRIR